ncbi:MAG: hypothetical protein AAFO91_08195 [Bacteroidota bacterium]
MHDVIDGECCVDTEIASLSHHIYSETTNTWVRQNSKPQPVIHITASVNPDDYKQLGLQMSPTFACNQTSITAIPDTGCQSCLAGFSLIQRLGISPSQLIPVSMKMSAANNSQITLMGAAVIRFTGKLKDGENVETRQIVYVTNATDKVYLSHEACVELGIVNHDFPKVGNATRSTIGETNTAACNANPDDDHCDCPKRSLPPPKPEKLPFSVASAEDVERLKGWLIRYYRSSSFNTCTHQPLPKMHGPPLRLMIRPDAIPVAHHTLPVPLHWMEQVKEGLDQDARMGVLKPVPVGEPVTRCHRMVVCAKKTGKPRRTVDLQALNKYALRETHHTQSPYIQARSVPPNKLKTVFDCWNGYHSIGLHPDDSHLTTFITP